MKLPPPYRGEPHTSEWFEAMMMANGQQAHHTMAIVAKAKGKKEVCSICGDEPAPVYEVVSPTPPDGTVATIRLDDDCMAIRKANFGERFKKLHD